MTMMDKQRQGNVPEPELLAPEDLPTPSHPLDGSQFHNVVDEQRWAELPPTPEEQAPRRVRRLPEPDALIPHPDDPGISIGNS